jgi:hypothetical protein
MKRLYSAKAIFCCLIVASTTQLKAQTPTSLAPGICDGVVANFNTNDNGFNSPSIYGSVFDSSFYFHAGRGYFTDYLPPQRTAAPGVPRVLNNISPPFTNPNPNGTFNVGFQYIVGNPAVDRFQVRIISVTFTPQGTVTNVEASSGVQFFAAHSSPTPYIDGVTSPVPDPTPLFNGFTGNVCIRLIDPDIANNPNTTFRVEVSYLLSTPTFAMFDNLSIGPLNSPLPVHFIGLVANRGAGNSANLKWDVTDEENVMEYQVETSTDGRSFHAAGAVPAAGKPIYTFTDTHVASGTVFYRIKSVDLDGRSKYSGILRLPGNADNSFGNLMIYPVPAKDNVTVQHKKLTTKARMIITTVDGRVAKEIIPAQGASHTIINISGLAAGTYFLRLDDGTGYGSAVKLIRD